jgi:hypothetical protein
MRQARVVATAFAILVGPTGCDRPMAIDGTLVPGSVTGRDPLHAERLSITRDGQRLEVRCEGCYASDILRECGHLPIAVRVRGWRVPFIGYIEAEAVLTKSGKGGGCALPHRSSAPFALRSTAGDEGAASVLQRRPPGT